jgi:hypothetical protein
LPKAGLFTLKKINIYRCIRFFCFIFALAPLYFSCGIDAPEYIYPIDVVSSTGVYYANIILPSGQTSEFRHYSIYYRIYLSDLLLDSITEIQRYNINSELDRHFLRLNPYTTNDNVSPATISSIFNELKFFNLFVSSDRINEISLNTVLSGSGEIQLDFTNSQGPTFKKNSDPPLYLFRANNFTALPNRLFVFSNQANELADENIISNDVNTDIQRKTDGSVLRASYAYVSLYIIATGIDSNYSPIYSRPTHIGIFRLP